MSTLDTFSITLAKSNRTLTLARSETNMSRARDNLKIDARQTIAMMNDCVLCWLIVGREG